MEDRIFDLLEKMYSELKNDLRTVGNQVANIENDIRTVGNQVANIENDLKPKVEAALEGYSVVYEKLIVIESKVDAINTKVEKQEVEIRVIKGGK